MNKWTSLSTIQQQLQPNAVALKRRGAKTAGEAWLPSITLSFLNHRVKLQCSTFNKQLFAFKLRRTNLTALMHWLILLLRFLGFSRSSRRLAGKNASIAAICVARAKNARDVAVANLVFCAVCANAAAALVFTKKLELTSESAMCITIMSLVGIWATRVC